MAPTIHPIAPDPDSVIILKHASAPFAQWPSAPELQSGTADSADASPAELNSACEERKEPPAISTGQESCERVLGKGGWSESRAVDGRYRIVAEDWDETALLTVLNVIHIRNRQVAKVVSLEEMAKIGVIVDYYEFGEAVEMFTTIWIQTLRRQSIPGIYCRELVLFIWVPFVFDMPREFEIATLEAIDTFTEAVQILGLPIPKAVTDQIDGRPCVAIDTLLSQLHDLLDVYCSDDYKCGSNEDLSFDCGSMLLGGLLKELPRLELLPLDQQHLILALNPERCLPKPRGCAHLRGFARAQNPSAPPTTRLRVNILASFAP